MTLRHLKIFVAVCESDSITAAAEKLYLAQPAVSLAIRELEEYYDIRLFDRISRRLYLTEAGREFLSYASHIVALFNEMEQGARDLSVRGRLRVGSSITVGNCYMTLYVKNFLVSHPDCDIRVKVTSSDEIESDILSSELDFAVIEGAVHSENIVTETYRDDALTAICPPDSPLAAEKTVASYELCKYPMLLREKGSGTRELIDTTLGSLGVNCEPAWESTDTMALIEAVGAGLGV